MDSIFEVDYRVEICCDYCNEPIHAHFHCPVCGDTYAGTTLYGDTIFDSEDNDFECEECGSQFEKLGFIDGKLKIRLTLRTRNDIKP